MDIKDINIRNLQTENVRLRNLLADKDALVKSIEHEKEEWTKEARVGYISLEEPRGRYTFSAEVLKSFGVDTSNLPEGAKAIVRKGKKDEWTIQLFYYSPAKVYTKVYRIGRFNVPKSDPMNSKRPQVIVESNPLMPSFCRFYFESKFAYNLSEENVLRMLESMKCRFPQSTLNKYIHQIMDYLRVRLESLMLEVIRSCGFVQNDETRILVRSRKSKEDNFKYNTEYIHAALSLEKKLVVMLLSLTTEYWC